VITLKQPTLCLNSSDVPGPHYAMSHTVKMPAGIKPLEVVNLIINAQSKARSGKGHGLSNIVINCHGYEGGLGLSTGGHGKEGITKSNVALFGLLATMNVPPIWLVACQAARGQAGQDFCQTLSNVARTMVIAGEDDQDVGVWETVRYYAGPSGRIDDYEGIVHIFYPNNTSIKNIDPEKVVMSVLV
jgi:hypothetical protein